ncbi:hypothetical protein LJY18_08755 [Pseudomonas sp. MMS21-TM103]|nr:MULTISPECIES: hypothetical protein [unclassified Pseudomonas]MCG4453392.1 hypothetical protein [Pseudomonas sp. MMS21 TM103]
MDRHLTGNTLVPPGLLQLTRQRHCLIRADASLYAYTPLRYQQARQ